MKKNKELAILFKKVVDSNKEIEFIPIKIIEGIYCKKNKCFIDKNGKKYYHIIQNPNSYGYCFHDSILNYKKDNQKLTLALIKLNLLRSIKKYAFTYNIEEETSAPLIFCEKKLTNKKNEPEKTILQNDETLTFYKEKFPEFYNKWINEEEHEEKELNIKELYKTLTSQIIDQEEAIKTILRHIWKQTSNVDNKTKTILIKGNSGVGKSKIFEILSKKLSIPIITVSANSYIINNGNYKNMEYIILELIKKAEGNIETAQKGIVVIDKFEKLIENVTLQIQDELEKLLEGTSMTLSSNQGDFCFDTSNLMIIGLSNNKKYSAKKNIGFENNIEENISKNLLDKFNTIIKMNDLSYESFIKILKSDKGLLTSNIEFLESKGVKVKISEPALTEMASKAIKGTHGVRSLDEIIETTLSVAEFEIASNPDIYSELIITEQTAENNKVYKLVKRKEH